MFRMADVDCITLEDSDDEPKMQQIIVRLDSNYFHVSNIFSGFCSYPDDIIIMFCSAYHGHG